MSTLTEAAPPAAAATPIGTHAGRPLYSWRNMPAGLRARTYIERVMGLQLGPGQAPVCYYEPFYHPDNVTPLYDPADAVPVPRNAGEAWAWRYARWCPRCRTYGNHVVSGPQCRSCSRRDMKQREAREARTCWGCRRHGRKPYPRASKYPWHRYCRHCVAKQRRAEQQLLTEMCRCAGNCGRRTATRAEILAWVNEPGRYRTVTHWTRRYCPPCDAEHQAELERRETEYAAERERRRLEEAERVQRARDARRQELARLAEWARDVLADPDTVLLDTETTGLHAEAVIVDLAVITAAGDVLIDTLINPGVPIPADATRIHGITDAMVTDAPSFADVVDKLVHTLAGCRVVIYNATYDTGILRHELWRLYAAETDPAAAVRTWMEAARWEDAMDPYAVWYGDWSDYWQSYTWQRLGGGHRACGDCFAVIDRLKEMARGK